MLYCKCISNNVVSTIIVFLNIIISKILNNLLDIGSIVTSGLNTIEDGDSIY